MIEETNILILDDHSLFSEGLKRVLVDNYQRAKVDKYENIAALALEGNVSDFSKYQLIISDIELPNEDTFSFLKKMQITGLYIIGAFVNI